MFRTIPCLALTNLFRVAVKGDQYLTQLNERTLVIAKHTSFIDAVMLDFHLPKSATFAINTLAKFTLFSIGLCVGIFIVPINAAWQEIGQMSTDSGGAVAIQNFFKTSRC